MLRKVVTIVSIGIAVGIALLALLAVVLPRLIQTDEFDRTLRSRAADALGRPVDWQRIEIGVLPPRLTVESPVVEGGAADGVPAGGSDASASTKGARLAAGSIDLRLAWWPLLRGQVEIDSLVLRGLEVEVVRTATGWIVPLGDDGGASSDEPEGPDVAGEESPADGMDARGGETTGPGSMGQAAGIALAFREFLLEGGRIRVHDRSGPTSSTWEIDAIRFEAEGDGPDRPIALEGSARLRLDGADRGALGAQGEATMEGEYAVAVNLDAVHLSVLESFVDELEASGLLSGQVSLEGRATTLASLEADLRVDDMAIRSGAATLQGDLTLAAGFEGDAPIALDAEFVGSEGGRFEADGTASREGAVDLALAFDRFDLRIVQPLLPDPTMRVAGRATGRGRIVGDATAPESVVLDLDVAEGLVRAAGLHLDGPFHFVLDAKSPLSDELRGKLDLDLSRSSFAFGEALRKKAGERASASIRLSPGGIDRTNFQGRMKLRNVDPVSLDGHFGRTSSVTITTPSFDLAGWSETIPALAAYAPRGSIAFDAFRFEPLPDAPARLAGRIDLADLDLQLGDGERFILQGALLGEGRSIRTKDLQVRAKGVRLSISGTVDDPIGEARSQLTIRSAEGTESNAVLSAWTSAEDTLYGALGLDANVAFVANGPAELLDTLDGRIRFSIGRDGGGRLKGASILERVLVQFPAVAEAARVAQALRGGRPLSDYFREDFEVIEGDLEIADGLVQARTLRLAYDGYQANLLGTLRLADLGLDMTGDLVLESDLVHLLTGVKGTAVAGREPLTIPLAGVKGTLSDPKISMTSATIAAVPKALLRTQGVEDALRRGALDALDDVLGGKVLRGSEKSAPPTPPPAPKTDGP